MPIFRFKVLLPLFAECRPSFRTVLCALLLLTAPLTLRAQSDNSGTITGSVTDSAGGAITNATVTLLSKEQGNTTNVPVNQRGEFLFSDVKPGSYTLSVKAATFETFITNDVAVNAGENVRLDAKLKPGSELTEVTVEAPSTTVDTQSATIATVIDPALVRDLPVDGNNVVALAALLPGVTGVAAPTTFTSDTGGPTYNVSGSRSNQNLFLLDGLMWNNVYFNTGLNFPTPFFLNEVSVQLNNFKAQYGRNVGSVFNALTKSGSNTFHGAVWDYLQNTAFNASDYISQRNPHLVQNQFGVTVGGPIKRDRIFAFLGYQGLLGTAEVDDKSQMPSLAERGQSAPGVARPCVSTQFAGMTCASFAEEFLTQETAFTAASPTVGVRNPTSSSNSYIASAVTQIQAAWTQQGGTGTSPCLTLLEAYGKEYLPNGEVPSICFNPVSVNLQNRYLVLPTEANPNGDGYSLTYAPEPRHDQDGFGRFDFNLGRHTIDARVYITATGDRTANGNTQTEGSSTYEPDVNTAGIKSGNVGDTLVLNANLLNVARVGYKRYTYTIIPTDPTNLINLGANANDPLVYQALPRVQVTNRWQLGGPNSDYSNNVNSSFEFDDSISYTHGNHNFQAGFQYLNLQYVHRFDQAPYLEAEVANTTVSEADFLFGLTYSETFQNSTNISASDNAFYFYAQDDWRATSRLTLNLGMRYELPKPWYQGDGQSVTFIPGYQSYRFPNTPSSLAFQNDPGVPNSIIKTNYTNLAPRFGFAYDLFGNGKTAIRGGFGIFYDTLNANTVGIGEPYHYSATYSMPAGGFSQPLLGLTPVPPSYTGPASAQFVGPYTVNFADKNVTEPYTEAVNFGIQQHIRQGVLELNYVGKFGRHQIVPYDLNPAIYDCSGSYYQANPAVYCPTPPGSSSSAGATAASYAARVRYPGFNYGGQGIVDNNSVGSSNYNGLQIIYVQRSRRNLTTVASYTYSRSLDDQSNGATNTAAVPLSPKVNTNYGPSDFQATHVVNFGWTYRLPNLKGGSFLARAVLNDWTFGGIFNARSGNPINITLAGDRSLTDERPERAPLAAGISRYVALPSNRHRSCSGTPYHDVFGNAVGCKEQEWFDIAEFNATPSYGYTNGVSRNYLYGPGFIETDANVRREVHLGDSNSSKLVEFRADAFNLWNTPNLGQPITSFSGSTATNASLQPGAIISTVGKNGAVGTNGRRVQLALILRY